MLRSSVSLALKRWIPKRRLFVSPFHQIQKFSFSDRSFSSAQPEDNNDVQLQPPLSLVGKEEVEEQEDRMRRISEVPISKVLRAKNESRWVDPVIPRNATIRDAIPTCIDGGLSGMMVIESTSDKRVVGLITSRDLLREMSRGFKASLDPETIMNKTMSEFMTPVDQVVYARPHETIGMCRAIMATRNIKCIPVLSKDGKQVKGLVTARDMTQFATKAEDRGGKKSYLRNYSERIMTSNTSMADPPAYIHAHLAMEQKPLYANVGVAEYPHPFKTTPDDMESGMHHHREYDPEELSVDPKWSEDAHFMSSVIVPDEKGNPSELTYVGVADGVGGWREYDIDPREFSRRLMEECDKLLHEKTSLHSSNQIMAPVELLDQAYKTVVQENVVGSCTACVAVFDTIRHQLHFSNLGDSGIIVLRHIDSDVAGALKRERNIPRTERKSDLRVNFVSQQQLHSFNHPYQLGWTGSLLDDEEETSFKFARDACTSSIQVRRGDIIIMATDGLFDNVHLEEIEAMALDWEQKCGFIRGGDTKAREERWAKGNSLTVLSAERVGDLALDLCKRARLNSLDAQKDSPFAILAKENDIMWSGGMPDDCTVVVMHVVGQSPIDAMDKAK